MEWATSFKVTGVNFPESGFAWHPERLPARMADAMTGRRNLEMRDCFMKILLMESLLLQFMTAGAKSVLCFPSAGWTNQIRRRDI